MHRRLIVAPRLVRGEAHGFGCATHKGWRYIGWNPPYKSTNETLSIPLSTGGKQKTVLLHRAYVSQVATWYVRPAPMYASTVMYVKVAIGQRHEFVSRLMIASVAAH